MKHQDANANVTINVLSFVYSVVGGNNRNDGCSTDSSSSSDIIKNHNLINE